MYFSVNYFHFVLLVIQAIFASEKIQDVIPLATNAILILGQGMVWIPWRNISYPFDRLFDRIYVGKFYKLNTI